MSALSYLKLAYGDGLLGHPLVYVSCPPSPNPAAGSHTSHSVEQAGLMAKAFDVL